MTTTGEKEQIKELYRRGYTDKEIGDIVHKRSKYVASLRRAMGFYRNQYELVYFKGIDGEPVARGTIKEISDSMEMPEHLIRSFIETENTEDGYALYAMEDIYD